MIYALQWSKANHLLTKLSAASAALCVVSASALAENSNYLDALPSTAVMPNDLMCAHIDKEPLQQLGATHRIACDAFKEYGDPPAPITDVGNTKLAIRVVFVPSFHAWSVVRIELSTPKSDGEAARYPVGFLTVKTELDEKSSIIRDATETGIPPTFVRTAKLSYGEIWLIIRTLKAADSFTLPSVRPQTSDCLDPTDSTIEIAANGQYHWAELVCGAQADARDDSDYELVQLLSLLVREHMHDALPDFPGE
jgi:hypothetical protein